MAAPEVKQAQELRVLLVGLPAAQADVFEASSATSPGGPFRMTRAGSLSEYATPESLADVDVVLLDIHGTSDARKLLTDVRAAASDVPLVIWGDHATQALGTEIVQVGAQDFVSRDNGDARSIGWALRYAVERHRLAQETLESGRPGRRDRALGTLQELGRLREINQFKTQLLNTAAHELSTPLTPIRLHLAMLRTAHEQLPAALARSVLVLERNVTRLSKLVGEILDVAQLEARRFEVTRRPVDLAAVVRETHESLRVLAEQAKVQLHFDAPDSLMLEADSDRLSQVLFNLISNAIKFTPEGGDVRVRVARDADFATVAVQDTGVGLRAADFRRLFQPFSQLHERNTSKFGGTGLGLYISQGIVEQHGGRIWCDSAGVGRGATFSFSLPLSSGSPGSEAQSEELSRPEGNGGGGRGLWPFVYFHCPMCDSRDIHMRIIRNRYECNRCEYNWK